MVVQTLFWVALPGLCYGLLAAWLLPGDDRTHRPGPVRRSLARAGSALARLAPRRRALAPPPEPDPFAVLALQVRLGVVAAQLLALERDPAVWARAKRLQAVRAAYDDLLAEACRLAGVPVPDDDGPRRRARSEPERFRAEIELAARGWSW